VGVVAPLEYNLRLIGQERSLDANVFSCATIRGICDYADSHKNNSWHKYASATAVEVTKEVLGIILTAIVEAAPPIAKA